MDAATVENVKWMMTYLNDCKASNVGQLFMAVQTYVWDHQSYKGEPGGDGDAGGYANADTYELYLSLIDSLLAKKAAEDAEFQRQIEEYAAQGTVCIRCGRPECKMGGIRDLQQPQESVILQLLWTAQAGGTGRACA